MLEQLAVQDLALEISPCHCCCTLLDKIVTKAHLVSRDQDMDPTSQWEESQDYSLRVNRMVNIAQLPLENTIPTISAYLALSINLVIKLN